MYLFPFGLFLRFDKVLIFSNIIQLQQATVNNDYYNANKIMLDTEMPIISVVLSTEPKETKNNNI